MPQAFVRRIAEGLNDFRDRPEEIALALERFIPKICHRRQVLRMELSHYGVEAMPKPESFPIDKIYVPVKRKRLSNLNSFKKSRKVF